MIGRRACLVAVDNGGTRMAVRTATAPKPAQKIQRELEDLQLVIKARNGSQHALDDLMRRYTGFVRLKASCTSSPVATATISSRRG